MLAWAGLWDAVPVILATFVLIDEVPRGLELLLNIVCLAVLLSAALRGATVHGLAARVLPGRS